jgi:chromatin remodeling complex protein RSC6
VEPAKIGRAPLTISAVAVSPGKRHQERQLSGEETMATKKKAGAEEAAATQTKAGTGIHAAVQPSKELGVIVGNDALPRSEVISKVWDYIKSKNLQNPENKREILADADLQKVFGRDKCTMFEMNKYISQHLTKA